ncbi:glycoside hydrolase family 3 N-terminal domain-containing protein [Pseudoduganella plicata]|uniref:Beta-glucosidase n=1 Tax=Pseudoduganella plicata TaxID=321984 RepID=A0A4P7BHU8_9BURK|nr:glycoside hydrolase family 3 N-terminal domain-containing protein [Pseudoduganella plicata]QBQ37205.1 glycoside hydrolase family 3 protein [Pseudoduganella plicata]GGY98559.1 beta-glucosidase [Pseudoduganella plicata]
MTRRVSRYLLALAAAPLLAVTAHSAPLADWPQVKSAVAPDARLEARVRAIVAGMTLEQKVGQMTQAEIKTATPEDVRRYYLGSVLNGGGSWPKGNKYAAPADWLALADAYYDASMSTDMKVKVPVIWGIDAMHGNSNVFGATLFPHNIGLGAARDPQRIKAMAQAVGKAVRATGINWVFAPTLAVVRDDRWGRTYESFSEDPRIVAQYAGVYVEGLQGDLRDDANVVATAKHYLGDGGTDQGKDRGVNRSGRQDMINIHGAGYYPALQAGAQTVMASYNSWRDDAAGKDYGKLHGNGELLTGVLKEKMGFDGFVVTDWNGIAEVPGCGNDSCPQAINAGIDMVMVPDDWKRFIANTVAQVKDGRIPMARIDDAVTRILRVKLRADLQKPSGSVHAGKVEALQARELARKLVQASLVLLKNDGGTLPLARDKRILVVGKSADSMANQAGGWTLTWQGTDNRNSDFPNGDTILAGIRAAAGGKVAYSPDGKGVDVRDFDAVVAVIGEGPYAEGDGDIGPAANLRHSARYPEDLAVLKTVAGQGKPVVTVFVSGRPLYVNDLLNLSDSFVAAWLPGSEGKGVADVLLRGADGKTAAPFTGKLSFSWPKSVCQTPLNVGDKDYAPLFAYGYGLAYGDRRKVGRLAEDTGTAGCGTTNAFPIFNQSDRATFPLYAQSGGERVALGADLNATYRLPTLAVETAQVNTQQDGKKVTWSGPGFIEAKADRPRALPAWATRQGALTFDTIVGAAPQGTVQVSIGTASVDVSAEFKRVAGKGRQTVKIPLSCYKGVDLTKVDNPFRVTAQAGLVAAFANIQVVGGAAADPGALECAH